MKQKFCYFLFSSHLHIVISVVLANAVERAAPVFALHHLSRSSASLRWARVIRICAIIRVLWQDAIAHHRVEDCAFPAGLLRERVLVL